MICGSCFRHASPEKRLESLCLLYAYKDIEKEEVKRTCPTCKLPMLFNPNFNRDSLVSSIHRTAARILNG